MTRIDRAPVQAPLLDRPSAEDGGFQANIQSAASAGSASAAGQVQASGWGVVPQPPLGGSRPPNEVFKNTNVMTMSESGPITFTFDGEEAAYNNSLVMLKLDARGNVTGTEPVFPDAENPGKSTEIDVKKGDRVAFMTIPNGGSSQATKDLLSDPDANLQLLNKTTGKPANLLTDKPEDIAYFSVDDCGKRTEIKGEGGLTFSVKRNPSDKGPDGRGFNSADIDVDPATGRVKVGMEDLIGGDNDLDDMNFTMDMGRRNAGGLVTPPRPGCPPEPPACPPEPPACLPDPPGRGPGWPSGPPGQGSGWTKKSGWS